MAIKLLSVEQMNELIDLKNRFLKFNGPIDFNHYDYDDEVGELNLTFFENGEACLLTITRDDVKTILQMDPSIQAFNDRTIKDKDNVTYESYDDYFDTVPAALFVDFIAIGRVLHKLNSTQFKKAA